MRPWAATEDEPFTPTTWFRAWNLSLPMAKQASFQGQDKKEALAIYNHLNHATLGSSLRSVGVPRPQLALPLRFLLLGNAFSEQTRNHSDLAVWRNVVFGFACPDPSTAGGFLFDSLNCLNM